MYIGEKMMIKVMFVMSASVLTVFSSMAMDSDKNALTLRSDSDSKGARVKVLAAAESHNQPNITPLKKIVRNEKDAYKFSNSTNVYALPTINPAAGLAFAVQLEKAKALREEEKKQIAAKAQRKAKREAVIALQGAEKATKLQAILEERETHFTDVDAYALAEKRVSRKRTGPNFKQSKQPAKKIRSDFAVFEMDSYNQLPVFSTPEKIVAPAIQNSKIRTTRSERSFTVNGRQIVDAAALQVETNADKPVRQDTRFLTRTVKAHEQKKSTQK
jgi:hypothetical protein